MNIEFCGFNGGGLCLKLDADILVIDYGVPYISRDLSAYEDIDCVMFCGEKCAD